MKNTSFPLSRDLVLIGGGHTHALLLRKWGMTPLAGARVTVINPGPTAPYSGMLPGFVAGHYSRQDLDIDLIKLARFAGARVILGAVDGIDPGAGMVHVPGRPRIGFDVCSVDVGITSDMPAVPGFAEHAVPAKPLGPFAARWDTYVKQSQSGAVAVIGAGVAGAELALAMAHTLKSRRRDVPVYLIDRSSALTVLGEKARNRVLAAMNRLGIVLIENAGIAGIAADHVLLDDGRQILADFVTGAAGARPYDWMAQTGLTLHEGFITVDAHLRSSDPRVFAVGDCAHLSASPRPKAGVFAVRQAPVLFDNLRAALSGAATRAFVPQKDYLKLISLGGTQALAEKSGLPVSGALMWRWKNHIDQTFMNQFRKLPAMAVPELPKTHALGLGDLAKPMCGGCGAKLGRSVLSRVVADLPKARSDVVPLPGDDAALLRMGDTRQVITTDHLRAVTEDPALMAEIAAVHALGDVWAMGAKPQAALAQIVIPRMAGALQERTLAEIMQVAGRVMQAAGADIIGGHSTMGSEMTIGFTVTGLCDEDPITLAGARPSDVLVLTKPLGSGVILAGEMAGRASGDSVAAAYASMILPQTRASRILSVATAMTDVTGFGLAGHLQGICDASGVGARLDLAAIPVLDGALALSAAGVQSTLYEDNRGLVPSLPDCDAARLLFDPQTAGGLLASVPQDQSEQVLTQLRDAGCHAAIIGVVTDQASSIALL